MVNGGLRKGAVTRKGTDGDEVVGKSAGAGLAGERGLGKGKRRLPAKGERVDQEKKSRVGASSGVNAPGSGDGGPGLRVDSRTQSPGGNEGGPGFTSRGTSQSATF